MNKNNVYREIEKDYDLEDGEPDGLSQEEIEEVLGVEPGSLDCYFCDEE